MAEDNLMLQLLRAIRPKQDEHTAALSEIRERVGFLDGQYGSLSRRVDRIGGDVERIKVRLDIIDTPQPV